MGNAVLARGIAAIAHDMLRGRPLVPELPGREASEADIEAVRRGESRLVDCILRGSCRPYPRWLTVGSLVMSAESATWTPVFRFPWRATLVIDFPALVVQARPPDHREWSRSDAGVMMPGEGGLVPKWMVVTARSTQGSLDFMIPSPDTPLVTAWLSDDIDGGPLPQASNLGLAS
jgi:hypothetical protein